MTALLDVFRGTRFSRLVEPLDLSFIDIGSRGGMDGGLHPVAWATSAVGFEPEPSECARLNGQPPGPWRAARYFPVALGGADGRLVLHVPASGEGASLLPHSGEMLDRFGYDGLHCGASEEHVEALTLDSALVRFSIASPDYLKIDVEGAELDILRAAPGALRGCSAVKVEVSFLEQRLGQPLMHEVAAFMLAAGFVLVDILGVHSWRRRPLPCHPYSGQWVVPYSRGQIAQCDLIFLRDPSRMTESSRLTRLFVVSSALGFFDHAVWTLRQAPSLEQELAYEVGGDLLGELGKVSRHMGRSVAFGELRARLRSIIPLLRSFVRGLPVRQPVRPGY